MNDDLQLTRKVVDLIRAHYDGDEARFREISDKLAQYFDQAGRNQVASFIRAQYGAEPVWVPMDDGGAE